MQIKMSKIESKLLDFFHRNIALIVMAFVTIVAVYVRYIMFPFISSDFSSFYLEWYNQIKSNGGLLGLSAYTGDYNYAYAFLLALVTYLPFKAEVSIKLFYVLFDFLGAFFAGSIAKEIYPDKKNVFVWGYSFVLVSPLVVLNSAMWGQCDFIYASIVLIALYLLIKEKINWAFFILGVAIAFKGQALFIVPLFVLVYLVEKKFSVLNFLFSVAGYILSCLPGVLLSGKGISGFFEIYIGQIQHGEWLVLNYPNIYYWISAKHYSLFVKVGICFTFLIFVFITFYLLNLKARLHNDQIIALGMWCVLCIVYFCPKMHERYGFLAEVLSLIWVVGHKKWIWYPIVMSTTVLFSYFAVLFGYNLYNFQDMAVVNIIAFLVFSIFFFKDIQQNRETT